MYVQESRNDSLCNLKPQNFVSMCKTKSKLFETQTVSKRDKKFSIWSPILYTNLNFIKIHSFSPIIYHLEVPIYHLNSELVVEGFG